MLKGLSCCTVFQKIVSKPRIVSAALIQSNFYALENCHVTEIFYILYLQKIIDAESICGNTVTGKNKSISEYLEDHKSEQSQKKNLRTSWNMLYKYL